MALFGTSNLPQLNEVLKLARDKGTDTAISQYKNELSAGEAEALKRLSGDEIRALAEINEKLLRAGVASALSPVAWNVNNAR
jgi:hypothetical protein